VADLSESLSSMYVPPGFWVFLFSEEFSSFALVPLLSLSLESYTTACCSVLASFEWLCNEGLCGSDLSSVSGKHQALVPLLAVSVGTAHRLIPFSPDRHRIFSPSFLPSTAMFSLGSEG
jgi:hypothetical protein